jgi:hypothetical protein
MVISKHAMPLSQKKAMEWIQLFNPFERVKPENQYKAHRISTVTSVLLVEVVFYITLCAYLLTKLMDNVVCMNTGNAYADTTGGRATCIAECPNFVAGDTCFDLSTNQANSITAIATICSVVFFVCVLKMWWIQKHDTDYEFPQWFVWGDLIFTISVTAAIGVCLAVTIAALKDAGGDSDLKRVTTLLTVALAVGLLIPVKLFTTLINMTNVGFKEAFACCYGSNYSATVVKGSDR